MLYSPSNGEKRCESGKSPDEIVTSSPASLNTSCSGLISSRWNSTDKRLSFVSPGSDGSPVVLSPFFNLTNWRRDAAEIAVPDETSKSSRLGQRQLPGSMSSP